MAVTTYEIADACGVSQPTVSRILANGPHRHSEKTTRRVLDMARQMGYRANAAARTTRTGAFGAVSLLLGTKKGRSSLPAGLLDGVQDVLNRQDLNLMLVRLPDERLTDREYVPRILRETCSDGLLIDYTHDIPHAMLKLIRGCRLPAVWINSKQPSDCVHPADYSASRLATRLLLDAGHARVAYADFSYGPAYPDPHYSSIDRLLGYRNEIEAAGLTPRVIRAVEGHTVPGERRVAFAADVLRADDRPSAVLCLAKTTAAAFYHAARGLGLAIPRALSIDSFDDAPADLLNPTPTTMVVPHREVGEQAVAMLLRKIAEPATPLSPVAVDFRLQPEPSIAPPR